MKCPLIIMNAPAANWGEGQEFANCLQVDCAWWDENADRCAVLEISRLLNAAGGTLGNIAYSGDMPRFTFRCHGCGLTASILSNIGPVPPTGWTTEEQVDGALAWYCQACAGSRR